MRRSEKMGQVERHSSMTQESLKALDRQADEDPAFRSMHSSPYDVQRPASRLLSPINCASQCFFFAG